MRWKGSGNSQPGHRRPRNSCGLYGLHREVGQLLDRDSAEGYQHCEVPELKITAGPNPTPSPGATHSPAGDTTLQHLGLLHGTQWSLLPSFAISKRTLSPFLSFQRNFSLQVRYTWHSDGESEIHNILKTPFQVSCVLS